ncbi:MAG: pyruvate dehydrogenase complex dihydrolipoamide acetyltransferase [Alphaproteobacteria bacterium]|nr:pyruvate dehydrogenase complex dihydrolipoamide acetyltransferase [Alphaproteobacteria bacterium]
MPIQILMPALSPTMTEGNLAKWLKNPGDKVKAGQVIAEIETDKATMEVEAVDDGTLAKILVPAGTQGVKINAPIAILAEDGESVEEALAAAPRSDAPPALPAPLQTATDSSAAIPAAVAAVSAVISAVADGARVIASPLAKRIAEQTGVDLKNLRGTGPGGRIVKADVENAHGKTDSLFKKIMGESQPPGPEASGLLNRLGMPYDVLPHSSMRKVIAKRLTESKQTVPHFYLSVDCELDALLALRKKMNEASGLKLSVNDCIIRATALAMCKVPAANTSWTDSAILQYNDVDISVAVATPGGLITPIIKKADTKTIAQISAEMKDLAARAKEGKLRPEEFQGGGFTISNLGMFGVRQFSAIINPPQSCILAIGAGEQRAVVKDGQLAVATVMTCTLSVDHRAVDGTVGAEFLAAFKPLIEKPYSLVV